MIRGADVVVRTLEYLGVDTVFGVPGSQNIFLYEALRKSGLRCVVGTDEMASAFMALGYARASGRVGVLTTIPGPGFAYVLPALIEASHDSTPILHISLSAETGGQRFTFQLIDQAALIRPAVKKLFECSEANDLSEAILAAFESALSGEPGPVSVQFPSSLQTAPTDAPAFVEQSSRTVPSEEQILRFAELLFNAKRPLLYTGLGASDAGPIVRELAEYLFAPVLSTTSGRATLAENHPLAFYSDLSFGVGRVTQELISKSDLIVALGCKFTHNGTSGFQLALPQDKLIQIDSAEENIGATFPVKVGFVGDVESFLKGIWKLRERYAGEREARKDDWSAELLDQLRRELDIERTKPIRGEPKIEADESISFQELFAALGKVYPQNTRVVTDSGMHQALARNYFQVLTTRGMVCPADFQSMGFGLPAAIGAKLAAPQSQVVAVLGDGSFLMTASELLSAIREKADCTVLVFNDGSFGRIRLQQLEKFGYEHGVELLNPNFEILCEALGCTYFRADGKLEQMFQTCLETSGVRLVEVVMKDSPAVRRTRVKSRIRERTHQLLGPRLVRTLKSLLRR